MRLNEDGKTVACNGCFISRNWRNCRRKLKEKNVIDVLVDKINALWEY